MLLRAEKVQLSHKRRWRTCWCEMKESFKIHPLSSSHSFPLPTSATDNDAAWRGSTPLSLSESNLLPGLDGARPLAGQLGKSANIRNNCRSVGLARQEEREGEAGQTPLPTMHPWSGRKAGKEG